MCLTLLGAGLLKRFLMQHCSDNCWLIAAVGVQLPSPHSLLKWPPGLGGDPGLGITGTFFLVLTQTWAVHPDKHGLCTGNKPRASREPSGRTPFHTRLNSNFQRGSQGQRLRLHCSEIAGGAGIPPYHMAAGGMRAAPALGVLLRPALR